MKREVIGMFPSEADVLIDYKNNKIEYTYLNKETFLKLVVNYTVCLLITVGLIACVIGIAFDIKGNYWGYTLAIILGLGIIIPYLQMYTKYGEKFKLLIPLSYQIRYQFRKNYKIYENINSSTIIVPMFDQNIVEWDATEDYEKYLEKVEVKGEEFYFGRGSPRDIKLFNLYAIFKFSQKPVMGRIIIKWY